MTSEISELKQLRATSIASTTEGARDAASLTSRLEEISQRLETISDEVIHFIENGASEKIDERKLWHDLNGLEHLVTQFSNHAEEAIETFRSSATPLIEALKAKRPK